jgi:hypothetical protein
MVSHNINPPPRPRKIVVVLAISSAAMFLLVVLGLLAPARLGFGLEDLLPWPSNSGDVRPTWHSFVRAPAGDIARPVRVLADYTTGNVTNPDGLISGRKPTVLSRSRTNHTIPSIVVDFGINTVGILSIRFAGAQGPGQSAPGIRLAFSETLQHLSDTSDFTRSWNVSTQTRRI